MYVPMDTYLILVKVKAAEIIHGYSWHRYRIDLLSHWIPRVKSPFWISLRYEIAIYIKRM